MGYFIWRAKAYFILIFYSLLHAKYFCKWTSFNNSLVKDERSFQIPVNQIKRALFYTLRRLPTFSNLYYQFNYLIAFDFGSQTSKDMNTPK